MKVNHRTQITNWFQQWHHSNPDNSSLRWSRNLPTRQAHSGSCLHQQQTTLQRNKLSPHNKIRPLHHWNLYSLQVALCKSPAKQPNILQFIWFNQLLQWRCQLGCHQIRAPKSCIACRTQPIRNCCRKAGPSNWFVWKDRCNPCPSEKVKHGKEATYPKRQKNPHAKEEKSC